MLRFVVNLNHFVTHQPLTLDSKLKRPAHEHVQLTAPFPVHTRMSLCTKIKAGFLHVHLYSPLSLSLALYFRSQNVTSKETDRCTWRLVWTSRRAVCSSGRTADMNCDLQGKGNGHGAAFLRLLAVRHPSSHTDWQFPVLSERTVSVVQSERIVK